jgi:phosphoadenosine phosphosulfate reductase
MVVISRDLECASAEEILKWSLDTYRGRVALACSFGGPTGIVAIDMVVRIDPTTPVYYLDTDLLFEATHRLVGQIRARYGIEPIPVEASLSLDEQRERYGDALWAVDPDLCCRLRKVEPQRAFLRNYDAWISGVRRDQTAARQAISVVDWDEQFALTKISPFARWNETMVWRYIREHDLPYNELHDQSYPSVGCIPCTRAIRAGESLRDGRWPGTAKLECGLHFAPAVRGSI